MVGRRFSQGGWERSYRAAVARAFGTVPYYREMWAEAGARREEPAPTPATRLETLLGRLCPLEAPYERRREEPAWIGESAELLEALRLTGEYRGERPLFEVRRALLDWGRLGSARYHVLLSVDAEVAGPEVREAGLRAFRAAREPAVLGDPGQLAELPEHPGRVRRLVRVPLNGRDAHDRDAHDRDAHDRDAHDRDAHDRDAHDRDAHGRDAHGHVLHDRLLGYLGGRRRDCRRIHLNWRRVHVRRTPAGMLFTLLRRRRPTLVGISVPGTEDLAVDLCREHGTPVLTRPGAVS
ncbi:hypothetical protein [Nonomuraea sp. NPDC050783]|uniref:hypothetical protein n=1 Tax=Nonomuraea sp. NPDC050783 TaxID=3154634 RepID=UPI0034670AB9